MFCYMVSFLVKEGREIEMTLDKFPSSSRSKHSALSIQYFKSQTEGKHGTLVLNTDVSVFTGDKKI